MTDERKVELANMYGEYWEDRINSFDYTEIDCFCEDNELEEDEIDFILNLKGEVNFG